MFQFAITAVVKDNHNVHDGKKDNNRQFPEDSREAMETRSQGLVKGRVERALHINVGHTFLQLAVSVSSASRGCAYLAYQVAAESTPKRGILRLAPACLWESGNCITHVPSHPLLSRWGYLLLFGAAAPATSLPSADMITRCGLDF
eukprot:s1163_g9.t1